MEAARLAAERAGPEEVAPLRAQLLARQARVGGSATAFVEADLAFHLAIIELSGNAVLLDLFTAVLPVLRTALVEMVEREPELPDTSRAHAELLAALETGDADGAIAATIDHLDVIIRLIRAREARR